MRIALLAWMDRRVAGAEAHVEREMRGFKALGHDVGRCEHLKAGHVLIDAMKHLRHHITLTIVGDGPSRGDGQKRASTLGARVRTGLGDPLATHAVVRLPRW